MRQRHCWVTLLILLAAVPGFGQDHLIFCNEPERIRSSGAYGDASLAADKTYTVFYHYRNCSGRTGPFVIALAGASGSPLRFRLRQGLADPTYDPPHAGRQAMLRLFHGQERQMVAQDGTANFRYPLPARQVASGILVITPEKDSRLRIYFGHDRRKAPGAVTVVVDAPRRDIEIPLSDDARQQRFRIGIPDEGMGPNLDGTYGMLYAFRIAAPPGRRVRVTFSPRGGKGGMVGDLDGMVVRSPIVPARCWKLLCETSAGGDGVTLTTAPFGGVFYPVELVFELI